MNAVKLVVGKKYIMDGNQEVWCRDYFEGEYARFEDESGDLDFEVEFDGNDWRHQSSGDLLVVEEVK